MTLTPSRAVVSFACAVMLLACGGTKNPDGGSDAAMDAAGATGGAAGAAGRPATGGTSGGGAPGAGGVSGQGGRGGRGSGGAGDGPGVSCARLASCCAMLPNQVLITSCVNAYAMVMAMGDLACANAIDQLGALGANCP
jgi:hypothetical protein